MFSVCFPEEIPDYDLPMDLGDDTDGMTLPDTYMDEMNVIGKAFDILGVSMIDSNNVTIYDACTDAMDLIGTSRILDASSPRP